MSLYPSIDQLQSTVTDDSVHYFTDAISVLNHWSPHAIEIWGRTFPTVEHAYHFRKFSDSRMDVAEQIAAAKSPYAAMLLAKEHKVSRQTDWDNVKVDIMTELDRAKATQHQDFRDVLVATGRRELIENSPWDSYWGCGADGNGQNIAGKILMKIRDELKLEES